MCPGELSWYTNVVNLYLSANLKKIMLLLKHGAIIPQ